MLANRLWAIMKVRARTREEAGWGSKWGLDREGLETWFRDEQEGSEMWMA